MASNVWECPCLYKIFQQVKRLLTESSGYIYICILYTNVDQKLWNKLYGPMHYKIGVTCVFNGHVVYTLL